MLFRIDLLNPTTGERTGDYPITTATGVSRRKPLSRIAAWEFDLSAADPALPDIEGKDFAVYWLHQGETVYLGQCSYLDHTIRAGDDGPVVQVQASGKLRDLTRQTVLQRSFDGASDDINDVLAEIVPLRSGWTLGEVDTLTNAAPLDFWYESVFDSVALLAETFGKHFREGSLDKTLDFGAMGEASGVLAVGGQRELPPGLYNNPNICQVTGLEVAYRSSEIINRLIPFGGAVGVATIDLSETTAFQASYPVQNAALPDGGSYYYIQDAASIATYGLTERRFLRKDLRPISNSPAARQYAANILYEAALASLLNLKDRQVIYSLSVTGLRPGLVRPGDKINLLYRGWASTPAGELLWLDVDEGGSGQGQAFYVLEINESFGEGVTTQLKINQNAVHEETVEDLLASTIRKFEQAQVHVQPTISRYTVGPYTKRVSTTVSATFSFKLGLETLDVWYVKIHVAGEPLKSSIQSVASTEVTTPAGGGGTTPDGGGGTTPSGGGGTTPSGGGGTTPSGGGSTSGDEDLHGHQWQINDDGSASSGKALYVKNGVVVADYGIDVNINTGAGNSHDHSTPSHTHSVPDHTHSTPTHTHSIPDHQHSIPDHQHTFTPTITATYGIYQDSVRPDSLTIKINGSTVASGVTLSAPNYDYELDITSQILAAATLQQEHTITIECGSNRGEIQFQAQVLAVIQGIEV